jgi:hypothetical protein
MIGKVMKETYICPRCSKRFGDRYEEDNLWFLTNAGYIEFGWCVDCETPEEDEKTTVIWNNYLVSKGLSTNA